MNPIDGNKMKMLYGVNQADACQAFALGDASQLSKSGCARSARA